VTRTGLARLFTCLMLTASAAVLAQVYASGDFLAGQKLDAKSKRDSVRIANRGTAYSGVQIQVTGAGNVIKRLTVQFDDRSSESFSDSHLQLQGQSTAVIWFRSGRQVVSKVSLLYHPDMPVSEGAEIRIYGIR